MAEHIEVTYVVNGTTCRDEFTAESASVQLWDGGRARLSLTGSSVSVVHYGRAECIVRRPEPKP